MALHICTIVARNYLAHARVLARSFQEHQPGGRCHVLVIDDHDGTVRAEDEPFDLVPVAALELPEWDEMRAAYDVLEFSTAVKPWLLRHMLRDHDEGDGIAYFDPDIRVISRMTELEAALAGHHLVLTPHLTEAMPRDGRKPSETDILIAGVFNLGFIGLRSSQEAHDLLDWWAERLLRDCRVAPHRGLFVDQRWVDFVPGLVADFEILRHPGYNVAYWNLPTREVARAADGELTVNGEPLRFFHFSGYDPRRPEDLSKHQNRVSLAALPVVAEICDAYAEALREAGIDQQRAIPYANDVLPSGVKLTSVLRGMYREGVENGEVPDSIWTTAGDAEFRAWLSEDSQEVPGLSRYLAEAWLVRDDVQSAYPDPAGADREGFLGWCHVYGTVENDLSPELIPAATGEDGTPVVAPVERAPRPFGVNVAGYLRAELGVGEVARQMLTALDAAGVPAIPVTALAPNSRQGHDFAGSGHDDNPFPVNLVCVNADGLAQFAQDAGEEFFEDRYTIGVWWWELGDFPERFDDAFDYVDELWVGSRFVADALAPRTTVPVVPVRVPVEFPPPPPLAPGELGWPRDGFTFLYSFDYNSVYRRKNPAGAVEAYTRAFGPQDGARLVLKSINGDRDPQNRDRLLALVADRPDITVIDEYVSARDRHRITASCDCYVSLHRSEGFGLTIAEAMYLGKPVIATGYSGNADFLDEQTGYPVRYELTAVGAGAEPYPASATWAEPDLDHAAELMREVFEHRDAARRRGAYAAESMRADYSPRAAGQVLRARLDRIRARVVAADSRGGGEAPGASASRTYAAELVARSPSAPASGPRGLVRRAVLRAMRPYTAYQHSVNLAQTEAREEAERELRRRLDAHVLQTAEVEAAALAELRRQRRLLEEVAERAATAADRLDRLVAETRSLPYMAAPGFETFSAPHAGTVLGYAGDGGGAPPADAGYRAFEDLFRGPEPFIAERQRRYLPLLEGHGPVLDVGCGRGELLGLLSEAGIEATGVDADAGMVARCREQGHAATVHGDGLEHLRGLADGSLGAVVALQVAEHLRPDDLRDLLALAHAKLRPGGVLVAETVNPHALAAMKTFWVDVTHQHPLFPETMLALARGAGFAGAYVFHPNGVGDVERDRFTTGEYALVATR